MVIKSSTTSLHLGWFMEFFKISMGSSSLEGIFNCREVKLENIFVSELFGRLTM